MHILKQNSLNKASKSRCSLFLVALLFAAGDFGRYMKTSIAISRLLKIGV